MKILGLIPARAGSKGVPGKNIKLLNGKPLLGYSIAVGQKSRRISRVVVSTEDEKIAAISRDLGAEVPFLRPKSLARDESPTLEAIVHALEYFINEGVYFDAVCLLQPTVPFRNVEEVDAAIEKFEAQGTDSLVSVRKVPDKFNPHWTYIAHKQTGFLTIATGEKEIISRRQDLPKSFIRDGSLYLSRTATLLEKNSIYGDQIAYYENTISPQINIDTIEDWLEAEKFAAGNES